MLTNHFVALGLTLSATQSEVVEAFEDAIAESPDRVDLLTEAKAALLNPRTRLQSEITALLEVPDKAASALLDRLKNLNPSTSAHELALQLAPLSKNNMLVHVSIASACDAQILVMIAKARAAIDEEDLLRTLQRRRKKAGMPPPSAASVSECLQSVLDRQSAALFKSFKSARDAALVTLDFVLSGLQVNEPRVSHEVDRLLDGYNQRISSENIILRRSIEEHLTRMRSRQVTSESLASLASDLRGWDALRQPFQIVESQKGRDEVESREVYGEVRAVSLYLANEQNDFKTARAVTALSLDVFGELPRASEQLGDDLAQIDEQLELSVNRDLFQYIKSFDDDLESIAASLRASGFSSSSTGKAKELHNLFLAAVRDAESTSQPEVPYLMLRSLAVDLNNNNQAAKEAALLLSEITSLMGYSKLKSDTRALIEDDHRTISNTLDAAKVIDLLKDEKLWEAQQLLTKLISNSTDPEERATFQNLHSGLEKKISSRRGIPWPAVILIAVFGGLILYANLKFPTTSNSGRSVPANVPQETAEVDTQREVVPIAGTGRTLTRDNIRYCVFENERLEAARDVVGDDTVENFNQAVEDWNSRCSDYRYQVEDLESVQRQRLAKATRLKQEGVAYQERWRNSHAGTPPNQTPAQSSSEPQEKVASKQPDNREVQAAFVPSSALNLERLDDAAYVQSRLISFGYLAGQPDGTWGPTSRRALWEFKLANALGANDGLDDDTVEMLKDPAAIANVNVDDPPDMDFDPVVYPPRQGATLNPLNQEDAAKINRRLRALGLYKGAREDLWSGRSRDSLREFKKRAGLPVDDQWDAVTEKLLFTPGL